MRGAERKLATMLFADVVGSTELATALDPEDFRARLEPFFHVARDVLTEYGGTLQKFIGDAVVAAFGVPRSHGDDPDRAVAAALELIRRIDEDGGGLALRVGIETGVVLAVEGGGDLDIAGEAVNAAARLQTAAQPGEVLVGGRTARSCRASELEPHGLIAAKGFPAPLAAWRVVGIASKARLAVTPFLGRDVELDLLRLAYRRAITQRAPELVTLTGDAGLGKTRLAYELFAELRELPEPPRILLGHNPAYGRGIAFWALGEVLRDAAGVGADTSVGRVRAALVDRVSSLGATDADDLAAALCVPLGGDGSDGGEESLKRAWRRFVALLAEDRPLVIGFDDIQWADDGLLDMIEEVTLGLADAPLLIVCTSRPELAECRPGFGGASPNVTRVALTPLSEGAATELSAALLPTASRHMAAKVAQTSGGNPFFAEEVSCRIADDPDAVTGDSRPLPETVHAAIAARLDRLAADDKRVVQHAAVLGLGFAADELTDLVGEPVADALARLAGKALLTERVSEGEGRYAFRHQLIRDVAYASLPRVDRARLHETAAAGIHARAGSRYVELSELIAFHLVLAAELQPKPDRRLAAYEATFEAAAHAMQRSATARSQELYEQAARLAPAVEQRLDSLRAAANVALGRIRGDEALRLRRLEAETAEQAGATGIAAAAYAQAVLIVSRMGGITGEVSEGDVRAMLARGRELVADDDVTRALLLLDEAWIAWRFNRLDGLSATVEAGLALACETGNVALISNALDAATALAWDEGRFHDALADAKRRLELIDDVGELTLELEYERSDALHMAIETLIQAGDLDEAAVWVERLRETDIARGVVHMAPTRGVVVAFLRGEWDEVLVRVREGREAWRELGRSPMPSHATAFAAAAAVHGYRGEREQSEEWFRLAESLASSFDEHRAGIAAIRGELLVHDGRVDDALAILPATVVGCSSWALPCLATRAEALVHAGSDDAPEAIAEALSRSAENPLARAIALRARARLDGDEAALRESFDTLQTLGCPHQAARSGWLLGGDARRDAEEMLAKLNVPLPQSDRV
jgi:class 3 adenylate cyclase/tetratricopeptide (TPR) repeat protein